MISIRPADARGTANLGWLDSRHSFSFGHYYDPEHMGFGPLRIIFDQLLPNAIGPVIVYWMTDLSLAILIGSSLGYLGLGAQPPTAEWGVMIADARNFMANAWWMSISPGIAIVLAGMSFSLLGDGVSEWLQRRN